MKLASRLLSVFTILVFLALLAFFGAKVAVVFLATFTIFIAGSLFLYGMVAQYGPLWFQRPLYLVWKNSLRERIKQGISPLIDYPFSAFVELELDREFQKGGLAQAEWACRRWFENHRQKMNNLIASIGGSRN